MRICISQCPCQWWTVRFFAMHSLECWSWDFFFFWGCIFFWDCVLWISSQRYSKPWSGAYWREAAGCMALWELGAFSRGSGGFYLNPDYCTDTQRSSCLSFFSCERGEKKWRRLWASNQTHWPWNSSLVICLSHYLMGLIGFSASLNSAYKGAPLWNA